MRKKQAVGDIDDVENGREFFEDVRYKIVGKFSFFPPLFLSISTFPVS